MRHQLASCVAILALSFASAAAAQNMVFRLEETGGGAPPPPTDGPPSATMINALRLYQQGAYQEAAILFERVIENGAIDLQPATQKKASDGPAATGAQGPERGLALDRPCDQAGCVERDAAPATLAIRARASSVRSLISLKHQRR
jgi:hypothetical protein